MRLELRPHDTHPKNGLVNEYAELMIICGDEQLLCIAVCLPSALFILISGAHMCSGVPAPRRTPAREKHARGQRRSRGGVCFYGISTRREGEEGGNERVNETEMKSRDERRGEQVAEEDKRESERE